MIISFFRFNKFIPLEKRIHRSAAWVTLWGSFCWNSIITARKFLTGLTAVTILLSAGVLATTAYAIHSWGDYHWARTSNPFTLKFGDNVSATWDGHLATASADWGVSSMVDTTIVAGKSKGSCQPTKGRVEVCNKNYGNNGWLGVASIWVSGNHITQGAVKVNDTYFNTTKYNTPAWRQFVMCQEVGHAFGLDHQDVNFNNANLGTCMDYTSNPSGPPSNEHPNAHDYDQLGLIYAHLDSVTTVGQMVSRPHGNGTAPEADDAGKVLRKDNRGRPALYERDMGKGEKLFTFIFWAE